MSCVHVCDAISFRCNDVMHKACTFFKVKLRVTHSDSYIVRMQIGGFAVPEILMVNSIIHMLTKSTEVQTLGAL